MLLSRHPRLQRLTALGAYVVVALIFLEPLWRRPETTVIGANDGLLFRWFLGEVPFAIRHGHDPLVSHLLLGGSPANLMWNTAVPLLGLLAWPVTALLGPGASLVALLTLSVVLDAFVAYLVLTRWARPFPASVGGLLFGLSPFVVGAVLGHLHLAFVPLVWVVLALGDDLIVRGRPWRRCGLLLGITVAAQALVSEEVLLTSAVTAALTVACLALVRRGEVRERLPSVARGVGLAAVVAGLLLAYPLAVQFFGPAHLTGGFPDAPHAVADAYGTVLPTRLQHLQPFGTATAARFPANGSESTSYLGVPLLALCAATAWRLRHQALVRVATVGLVVTAVLALGAHLVVGGSPTTVPLPWRALVHVPLFESVITVRLSLYTALFAAVLVAVGASSWTERRSRRVATAVTLLALVPLLPLRLHPARFLVPAFFTTSADLRVVDAHRPALVLPYPSSADATAMGWQAEGGYRLTLFGGYVVVPGAHGQTAFGPTPNGLEAALRDIGVGRRAAWTASDVASWRRDLARMDPSAIVLGPTARDALLTTVVEQLTGRRPTSLGGVDLWLPGRRPQPSWVT